MGIIEEVNEPFKEDVFSFMKDVAPAVIGQQDSMAVFLNALLSEDKGLLEPAHLYNTLVMAMVMLHGCYPHLIMSDETRGKALYALARIFQRYRCHGSMAAFPYSFHRISGMTLRCL